MNKFRLEIRRRFLIIRAIKISSSLPTGIVEAKKLITLKMKHNQFMKDFVRYAACESRRLNLSNAATPSLSSEIFLTSAETNPDSCSGRPKSSTSRSQKSFYYGCAGFGCLHSFSNLLLIEPYMN